MKQHLDLKVVDDDEEIFLSMMRTVHTMISANIADRALDLLMTFQAKNLVPSLRNGWWYTSHHAVNDLTICLYKVFLKLKISPNFNFKA